MKENPQWGRIDKASQVALEVFMEPVDPLYSSKDYEYLISLIANPTSIPGAIHDNLDQLATYISKPTILKSSIIAQFGRKAAADLLVEHREFLKRASAHIFYLDDLIDFQPLRPAGTSVPSFTISLFTDFYDLDTDDRVQIISGEFTKICNDFKTKGIVKYLPLSTAYLHADRLRNKDFEYIIEEAFNINADCRMLAGALRGYPVNMTGAETQYLIDKMKTIIYSHPLIGALVVTEFNQKLNDHKKRLGMNAGKQN